MDNDKNVKILNNFIEESLSKGSNEEIAETLIGGALSLLTIAFSGMNQDQIDSACKGIQMNVEHKINMMNFINDFAEEIGESQDKIYHILLKIQEVISSNRDNKSFPGALIPFGDLSAYVSKSDRWAVQIKKQKDGKIVNYHIPVEEFGIV